MQKEEENHSGVKKAESDTLPFGQIVASKSTMSSEKVKVNISSLSRTIFSIQVLTSATERFLCERETAHTVRYKGLT